MFRKLAKSVKGYWKETLLAPTTVAIEVVMEVLIPYLMATLIDKGIEVGNMNVIVRMGLIMLLCCAISMAGGAFAGIFAAKASAGFAKNMRRRLFHAVQGFSFTNIDKFSTSSLVTRLTTDVSFVQNSFQMLIRIAVRSPLMMIFSLIMASRVSPKLSLIFLSVVPVLGLGLFIIAKNAMPTFSKVFKTYDEMNNVVDENLSGIRVVKAFVRGDHENHKFRSVSEKLYNLYVKAEHILAFNSPLMSLCMYTCTLLVSWFGARLIVMSGGTTLSTGGLTSLFSYTSQMLMSLMSLSMIFVMLTISKTSAQRIVEVLDETSDIVSPKNAVTEVKDGSIQFKNVNFSYSGSTNLLHLKGVDLDIKSGETIGIIGSTGSGKSTLVQIIPRLYDATEGQVLVGGVDVKEYDLDTLRNQVAMVLQKNTLFSGTIKDNLRWGDPNATDEEIEEACRLANAHEFVCARPEGYDTYIEQGGTNVSGGQKQRLCIARALLKRPKILILDDSTSAVDTATDAKIRQSFRDYIPDTTKLIIAQRISSVQDADRIIVLDGGAIVDIGTHQELLDRCHIYQEVYYSQLKGGADNE
ncbi:MAG: ABC transporter ATP-binding protein [Clostridia bacterium]|nr:ABC transporter ATP-binding protein [Clostridia bacterium]